MRNLLTLILSLQFLLAFGQGDFVPKIRFAEDSVKVGYPTPLVLTHTHPVNWEVYFPDSSSNLEPFEFDHKLVFQTVSNDSLSTDCTIYFLRTFELEDVQKLGLEVKVLEGKDTIGLKSNIDSIHLKRVITSQPDSIKLKADTEYLEIEKPINGPILASIIGAVIIVMGIGLVLFRKKLLALWLSYRMKKRFERFVIDFSEKSGQLENGKDWENLLQLWKNYLTNVEGLPVNSYSTKEIQQVFTNQDLINALKSIDGKIYGNQDITNHDQITDLLKSFANSRYELKIQSIRSHG